jgi:hypothetical protein
MAMAGRPSRDAELNARLTEVGGWIATIEGDGARAKDLFGESRSSASKAFGPYHTKTRDAMRGLIYAERLLRNFDGALALQAELEAATSRALDKDPREGPALGDLRADLLDSAGRLAQALSHVSIALPACVKAFGPHDEFCRRLFLRKMRVMLKLGMTGFDSDDQAFVDQLSRDTTSPALRVEALILQLRIESMRERTPRQDALFARVASFGASGAEVQINPLLKSLAVLSLAEAELRRGHAAAAGKRVDDVLERLGSGTTSLPLKSVMAFGETLMGVSLLQSGQPAAALTWMKQGENDMAAVYGAQHPLTAMYSVNRAVALAALGRFREAQDIVTAAQPILGQAMGASAPTYLRVLRLQGRLERAQASGATELFTNDFFS